MKHTFNFEFEFENDEGDVAQRIVHSHAEEAPQVGEMVVEMAKFLSAAYGYPITLDYEINA
jgi:hypothetical protein